MSGQVLALADFTPRSRRALARRYADEARDAGDVDRGAMFDAVADAAELELDAEEGRLPASASTRSAAHIDSNDDEAARNVLRPVACTDLATATLLPPQFVVGKVIPRRHVTLLGGHGGLGKSTLALVLAAHVAYGRAWAGCEVAQGRVLVVSLEDSAELARWRLRAICETYGLDAGAVGRNLSILDGSAVGDTSLVASTIADGRRKTIGTAALAQIRDAAKGCELIVIDGASDAFAGSEIDRAQVSGFIRKLAAELARPGDAAVILLGHVDKASAKFGSNGQNFSGSTAWHNSVRSRLALVDADGAIELRHEKANLGRRIDPILLRVDERGVLLPRAQADTDAGAALVEQGDADALHAALVAAGAQGVTVHAARTGPATAQHVLATMPELPQGLHGPKGRARFWAALARLQREGRAGSEDYMDSSRHRRQRLVARVLA